MIEVLRLGHRLPRDCRISTHCCLVARAFGADKIFYSGQKDKEMEDVVKKTVKNFGGLFEIEYINDDVKFLREKKENGFKVIHLTMYGENYNIFRKKKENYLIIIGGSKVSGIFYKESDFNISIGKQPHSEVGALAVFLYYLDLKMNFDNEKIKILESKNGKYLKIKR
ncbi:tRNA (cytidine(56)-2'-O)-methyltransferase [Candidatus Woesearchaeota archaeon]|nr:tRNA (cytidine(56)-2'-O)-methyltransferase [Candidatus Woesearchaeota archaeon]